MPVHAWLTTNVPPANEYICRLLRIPNDLYFIANVNGALLSLCEKWNWQKHGAMTVDETVAAMTAMYDEYAQGYVCMLGSILPYATSTPPVNTLPCDGSQHLRADYPRLYAALDTIYIVDADNFITPDLRGRTVIGVGQGTGLTNRAIGDNGGEETHVLTEAELATHTHTTQAHTHTTQPHTHTDAGHTHLVPIPTFLAVEPGEAPTYTPIGAPNVVLSLTGNANILSAGVTVDSASVTVDNTGEDTAHENMQPFHALKYCMIAR